MERRKTGVERTFLEWSEGRLEWSEFSWYGAKEDVGGANFLGMERGRLEWSEFSWYGAKEEWSEFSWYGAKEDRSGAKLLGMERRKGRMERSYLGWRGGR